MDSLISAAALALSKGDVLEALNHIALRDDPSALALRGVVMAQLGELERGRELLARAARGFGTEQSVSRARCIVAEAEIALVSRDLGWSVAPLEAALRVLDKQGDVLNAAHARIIAARRNLLLGRLDDALKDLRRIDQARLPPALLASYELALVGMHIRRLEATEARLALHRASDAARQLRNRALNAEVEGLRGTLEEPIAVLQWNGNTGPATLEVVEVLLRSGCLVVDATRNALLQGQNMVSLSTRPVLFALLLGLAQSWPESAPRQALLEKAFNARHADESHRMRLRVEIARLRKIIGALAEISATKAGFRLIPRHGTLAVLTTELDGLDAMLMAMLDDGEMWSSSALALVLDSSVRTIQRALKRLGQSGKVEAAGSGRTRRWRRRHRHGFPTALLLPEAR